MMKFYLYLYLLFSLIHATMLSKSLLWKDPKLAVALIEHELKSSDPSKMLKYVPWLVESGHFQVLQKVPLQAWRSLFTSLNQRKARGKLLNLFEESSRKQLATLAELIDNDKISVSGLVKHLKVFSLSYVRIGELLGRLPTDLILEIIAQLDLFDQLSMMEVNRWFSRLLRPILHEKLGALPHLGQSTGLNLWAAYKCYRAKGLGKVMADALFDCPTLLRIDPLSREQGFSCPLDRLISAHIRPSVIAILIDQYPAQIMRHFSIKTFLHAYFLDAPVLTLKSIIKASPQFLPEMLYVVGTVPGFSLEFRQICSRRLRLPLESTYMIECLLAHVWDLGVMESIIDTVQDPNMYLRIGDLLQMLRLGLDTGRFNFILKTFKVDLSDGFVMKRLLELGVNEANLLEQLKFQANPGKYTKSLVATAINQGYSDELSSFIITHAITESSENTDEPPQKEQEHLSNPLYTGMMMEVLDRLENAFW